MKVVTQAIPIIKVIPRFYPLISDALTIEFESGIVVPFTWVTNENKIVFTFTDTSLFTQTENYSFTIKNGSIVIYKGKIIFLKNNTDVQNYTNQSQDTRRWQ